MRRRRSAGACAAAHSRVTSWRARAPAPAPLPRPATARAHALAFLGASSAGPRARPPLRRPWRRRLALPRRACPGSRAAPPSGRSPGRWPALACARCATICLPAIFSSIAARMRFFSSSSNVVRVVRLLGDLVDQLQRQLQLGLRDVDLLDVEVLHRAHLVGVEQLLQHQAVFGRAHLHHVLLALPRPSAPARSGRSRASPRSAARRACRRACRAPGSRPCRSRSGRPTSRE